MNSNPIIPDDSGSPVTQEIIGDSERLQAFTTEWARSQSSVRAYLGSFFSDHNLLNDYVQEVALVAWRKAPLDAGSSAFLGHVLATARFVALGAIRKKQCNRLQHFSPEIAQVLADTVAEQAEAEQEAASNRVAALRHCLDKLEPEPRKLLEIRYYLDGNEGLKAEAKRLGKSIDAIYKKLERLRDLLRACVSKQLDATE